LAQPITFSTSAENNAHDWTGNSDDSDSNPFSTDHSGLLYIVLRYSQACRFYKELGKELTDGVQDQTYISEDSKAEIFLLSPLNIPGRQMKLDIADVNGLKTLIPSVEDQMMAKRDTCSFDITTFIEANRKRGCAFSMTSGSRIKMIITVDDLYFLTSSNHANSSLV
jgi:hypothetical protein